jgi:hypothetical protein
MNHLHSDQLIDSIYGVGSTSTRAHLESCAVCEGRLKAFELQRSAAPDTMLFKSADLLAQRHSIYARLEQSSGRRSWAPALVAAGLLVATFTVFNQPSETVPVAARADASASEAETLDLFASELEPLAAAPLRGLFETALETTGETGK